MHPCTVGLSTMDIKLTPGVARYTLNAEEVRVKE